MKNESGKNRINAFGVLIVVGIIGKVYVSNWMQVKTDQWRYTNFNGSLKARVGLLLALCAFALQPTIGSWCHIENSLKSFVETALFLIAAVERNRFY